MVDPLSDFSNIAEKYLKDVPFLCSDDFFDPRKSLLMNKWKCLFYEMNKIQNDEKALNILVYIKKYRLSSSDKEYAYLFVKEYPMITWILSIAEEYRSGIDIVVKAATELPYSLIPLLDRIVKKPNIIYYIDDLETADFLLQEYPDLITLFSDEKLKWYARAGIIFPFLWVLERSKEMPSIEKIRDFFYGAARNGEIELLKFLIERFPHDEKALEEAYSGADAKGQYGVMKYLLTIYFPDNVYGLIRSTLTPFFEAPEVFRLLINHPRVDPSFDNNVILYDALDSMGGQEWAIGQLLEHPRIRLSSKDYETVFDWALSEDNIDIVNIILKGGHIKPNEEMIEYAQNEGYWELASLLEEYIGFRP